ncbi:type II toxin-antitoxin system RelE/ParE family toxin [Gallibacterium melopsittaci]|uniref:Type II toxin-antitoxin system RelE/ParE family toxin n=1 Tax=Gallibacterium melopsittaci TaxID=516063 RepID=A0ABV6HX23_9PAST
MGLLSLERPQLGRPYVDTLQGSKYVNLKELRVQSKQSVFRLFLILYDKQLFYVVAIKKKK